LSQEPASTFALRHLDLHLEWVRLWIQRHMRRYADRLVLTSGSYSDECVGRDELTRLLGQRPAQEPQSNGTTFLDSLQVENEAALDARLTAHQELLVAQTQAWAIEEGVLLPLEELRASFQLSDTELKLLVVALAPRVSIDFARLFSVAMADFNLRQPSAGFMAELLAEPGERLEEVLDCLRAEARLRRYRLVTLHEDERWQPETPLVHAPVSVPQRVVDFVQGVVATTNAAGTFLQESTLPLHELVVEPLVLEKLLGALRKPRPRLLLRGPAGIGRRTLIAAIVGQGRQKVFEVALCDAFNVEEGPSSVDVGVQVSDLLREARFFNALLLLRFDGVDETPTGSRLLARSAWLQDLLADYPGPIVGTAAGDSVLAQRLLGSMQEITFSLPPHDAQANLWRRLLTPHLSEKAVERMIVELSPGYQMTPGAMHRAVATYLEETPRRGRNGGFSTAPLVRIVRRQIDHRLGFLADPISTSMRLTDVVLADKAKEQLAEVLSFARHSERVFQTWGFRHCSPSGRGLSVMFSGPPGTGKTLLATVIAAELGRVIYRIDLSRIVDKYIGETEKNLGRVFDEAEKAQAVLLFDEADSLFASRTSVKSSNDRYANLEVNFLLQRLDAYDGVSILTTNFVQSLDEAFQRRIRFKVDFPMPSEALRAKLWRTLMPPEAPVADDIDYGALGRGFELSGGHIRSAVLRAAIAAAEGDCKIKNCLLWDAAVAESREMGALVSGGTYSERSSQQTLSGNRDSK